MHGDAHLAGLGRLLGELERGLAAVGEEEALDVVEFRTLDERRDRRRRQVGLLELLRGAERRDEGAGHTRSDRADRDNGKGECSPVVAGDNDTAGTGLLALLDEVDLVEALALVGSLELLSELVVADTAGVDDRVRRENVLRTTLVNIH